MNDSELDEALRLYARVEPGSDLEARVLRRVRSHRYWPWLAMAAAAAAFIVMLVWPHHPIAGPVAPLIGRAELPVKVSAPSKSTLRHKVNRRPVRMTREEEALQNFAARLAPEQLAAGEPEPIRVDPLVIEPLELIVE